MEKKWKKVTKSEEIKMWKKWQTGEKSEKKWKKNIWKVKKK